MQDSEQDKEGEIKDRATHAVKFIEDIGQLEA